MITLMAGGIGLIVLLAVMVGVLDAVSAPMWREVAAERRRSWEERQLGHLDDTPDAPVTQREKK